MIDTGKMLESVERLERVFGGETRATQSIGEVKELLVNLRQAEKDAARYRWIKENSQLGVGRCGVDWELYFEGPAPDNSAMIERHIDEAMQCK